MLAAAWDRSPANFRADRPLLPSLACPESCPARSRPSRPQAVRVFDGAGRSVVIAFLQPISGGMRRKANMPSAADLSTTSRRPRPLGPWAWARRVRPLTAQKKADRIGQYL